MPDINPRYASLFQATVKDAAAGGAALMGKLIVSLRRELQARESASRDIRERDVHVESLKQLHLHEQTLRKDYGPALLEQFTRPTEAVKASPPSDNKVQFDQLELMNEAQVQERVNVARTQQMAMSAAEASLAELNALICTTLGLQTVRPERNPLRPEAYITALRNAVERTPVPAGMRLDWLAVMGSALGAELKVLYASLSMQLKTQGVVAAGYAVTSTPSSTGAPREAIKTPKTPEPTPSSLQPGVSGDAGPRPWSTRVSKAPKPGADPALLTLDRLRKLLAGEVDSLGKPQGVAAFAQEFARQFDLPGNEGASYLEAQPDFATTVPAAFDALTEMNQVHHVVQRLEQRRLGEARSFGSQRSQAVREEIRRSASDVAQALSLEVVNLMVDNIARDPRLLDPVRNVVRALEPALMRLALVDARLFTDKHHAARILIQEITHRSLAYASVQSFGFLAYVNAVREAIAPLVNAPLEGPEPFVNALHGLQAIWQEEALNQSQTHNHAVKALEKVEQRNVLAEKIAHEIDSHPDAAKVPEVVLTFLCGPWAQVVAQARLSGGAGSLVADKYQALISAMLWSAHPDLAHKNIAKLTKLVPLLLSTLREGLETIQYPATKSSVFFEALMGLHQAAFRAAHQEATTAAVKSAEQAQPALAAPVRKRVVEEDDLWVAPSEAKDSNFLDISDDTVDVASALPSSAHPTPFPEVSAEVFSWTSGSDANGLQLGAWVELHTHGEWVRTQLTWASPHGTLFLFTSAAGATQSMTRRTYDKLLAAGQLRIIAAQPLIEVALDAVAQQAMKNSVDISI